MLNNTKTTGYFLNTHPAPSKDPVLIVFSHLRWEFVTQRPQHIITRLAKYRKVLFIEEPVDFDPAEKGKARIFTGAPNVTVIQPRAESKDLADSIASILNELPDNLSSPDLWFYSAAFHSVSEKISHALVIYDCMDELSAFKGASPQLIEQERLLMEKADVVFTGGKSLYESKRKLHNNVHCYPSSVDREHFEKAIREETAVPEDIQAISHPIAGYYGVIDERIDLQLLDDVSKQNPRVSFVMIGPVVKISNHDLPQRSNIHYLGSKPYNLLPNYLKAIDIAIMPFALNEATRFISPTKTLEYLAGLKPVISTPVHDVVRDYSKMIRIVKNTGEFTAAIQYFGKESTEERQARLRLYYKQLRAASWDRTVQGMQNDIAQCRTREYNPTLTSLTTNIS